MALPEPTAAPRSRMGSVLRLLHPGHAHTAFTATLLLAAAAFASKIISLVRVKYFTHLLGRSGAADALQAMFQLPDMISYFLIGGATSITFVTMLTRYRETGREAEGEEALSVILSTMLVVLGAAVVGAEFLAPLYVRTFFPGFSHDPAKFALCVHLTRIILPGQVFFFAGGIFGAVLLARRQFTLQAFAPLIYNAGMIVGGVLLYSRLGVSSIAWGGVAGVMLGPFAVNALGARSAGMRIRLHLDFRNRGLHEWLRTTLPLILGFSLVTVDTWIISYFASHVGGAVAVLGYAKQLFGVPQALGQAAGAASLPFLASLYGKEGNLPFARSVNSSVSRIAAFSLLLIAWLIPMSGAAVDFFFRGGHFSRADTGATAVYLAIFALSLPLWSAQAIYARAFYATGNTLTPMIASTIVVVLSLPVYAALFHLRGAPGLAFASDIGITVQTTVFAVLLDRRGMARLGDLEWRELARCLLAGGISVAALFALRAALPAVLSRAVEGVLLLGSVMLWLGICYAVLHWSGSALLRQLAGRLRGSRAVAAQT